MSNKLYDFLKFFVTIFLQALGTFLLAIGSAWNLPMLIKIALTVSASVTFATSLLSSASKNYMKNKTIIEKEDK